MNQDQSNITNIDHREEKPDENRYQNTNVNVAKAPDIQNWSGESFETNQSKRTLPDARGATIKQRTARGKTKKSKVINIDTWNKFTLVDKIKSQVSF